MLWEYVNLLVLGYTMLHLIDSWQTVYLVNVLCWVSCNLFNEDVGITMFAVALFNNWQAGICGIDSESPPIRLVKAYRNMFS